MVDDMHTLIDHLHPDGAVSILKRLVNELERDQQHHQGLVVVDLERSEQHRGIAQQNRHYIRALHTWLSGEVQR